MQTRRQELQDNEKFAQLSEDEKRVAIRNELAAHNKYLAAAAKDAGVETSLGYAIIQDHGYRAPLKIQTPSRCCVTHPSGTRTSARQKFLTLTYQTYAARLKIFRALPGLGF